MRLSSELHTHTHTQLIFKKTSNYYKWEELTKMAKDPQRSLCSRMRPRVKVNAREECDMHAQKASQGPRRLLVMMVVKRRGCFG